ncbi:unnamed protein product [Angiostrongylus costaricensis]|uniref:POU domain protein n=1 Tax=Angiostrongylus costaricensis TaxID=334426 RepID=A0A158PKS2_ANGCS|nr:unnamed protein product [Angiostrongylus costaricensis]
MSTTPSQLGANMLSGLSTQQLAALTGVLGGQHGFNQAQLAALTVPGGVGIANTLSGGIVTVSQQQVCTPVQPAVAAEGKNSINAAPQNGSGSTADIAIPSLPWPIVSPMMSIPYFDLASYRLVDLDVAPSRDANGFDLPLADVTTLRFFFNLGVQHSRSLAATQLYQERLAHGGVIPTLSTSVSQTPQTSLPTVPQLGGVNILPSLVNLGGSRAMEPYLGQLNIMSPHAQALLREASSHHMTQQAQALAAISSRLPDRHLPGFAGSTVPVDIFAMAAQLPISVSVSAPAPQLLRQPILPNGAASMSSNTSASPLNSKQMPPNSAATEQQSYYLQQALSVVANVQTEKTETRMHMLQQQAGGLGLHAFVRTSPEEILKPVALGGGSSDAALSPRPPPVDPSPPRIITDTVTSISEGTPFTVVHQQVRDESQVIPAQTSPPASRDQCMQILEKNYISRNNTSPQNQRGLGSTTQLVSRITPQSSAPSTPVLTADDVVPVSQTLFQVSEQHFTEAFNASRKKSISHPIGIARKDNINTREDSVNAECSSIPRPNQAIDRKDQVEKPALAPILMMTYLSNCMNNIKSTLNTNGLPVGLDANGRAVDYSSRPIDPIFQQARARMENAREFRGVSPPNAISQLSSSRGAVLDDGTVIYFTGPRFSPLSLAPKISPSSSVSSKTSTNPLGINRVVPDAIDVERIEHGVADTNSPVGKRMRVGSEENSH